MSNTRFFYDDCRTQKALEEATYKGNYFLNTPGCGTNPYFFTDPNIRVQTWGGNLSNNKTELESDLKGLTRKLNRDNIKSNKHLDYSIKNMLYDKKWAPEFNNEITGQSRTTHPAWKYREVDSQNVANNFNYLFLDPQEHTFVPFHNNISTRIIGKDLYNEHNTIY